MRVLYDGTIYSMQKAGGINRYFANLISRLPNTVHPTLSLEGTAGLNFPSHSNLKLHNTKRFDFRPRRLSHRLQRHYNRRLTTSVKFDVAHPTYYTSATSQNVADYKCPVVVTVYDMVHELFPSLTDPGGRHAEEKRAAIMAAQAVICISENTKYDLLERYPVPEEKISITHLASGMLPSQAYGAEPVPDRPYFLYVGSRAKYKNFDSLLLACARVADSRPSVTLCVVGAPFTSVEEQALADLKLTGHVEHYGHVNDNHLAKLYRCSLAFVYPSLYEGFGIPPLEAMACGTLVVAADCSSIPEVVGDAGILFDPRSMSDLTDILLSILDRPSWRDVYIEKGRVKAEEFTWQKTVAQTLAVYQSLVTK